MFAQLVYVESDKKKEVKWNDTLPDWGTECGADASSIVAPSSNGKWKCRCVMCLMIAKNENNKMGPNPEHEEENRGKNENWLEALQKGCDTFHVSRTYNFNYARARVRTINAASSRRRTNARSWGISLKFDYYTLAGRVKHIPFTYVWCECDQMWWVRVCVLGCVLLFGPMLMNAAHVHSIFMNNLV